MLTKVVIVNDYFQFARSIISRFEDFYRILTSKFGMLIFYFKTRGNFFYFFILIYSLVLLFISKLNFFSDCNFNLLLLLLMIIYYDAWLISKTKMAFNYKMWSNPSGTWHKNLDIFNNRKLIYLQTLSTWFLWFEWVYQHQIFTVELLYFR